MRWLLIPLLLLLTCRMPFKFKNTPPQPHIDEISQVGGEVTVKLYAEDPEDDKVSLKVDFGDGYVTQWSEFVQSGYILTFTHQYSSSGNYTMKIQAKDEYGAESKLLDYVIGLNLPDISIYGPDTAHVNDSVTFVVKVTDPDGDKVAVRFDWGDGDTSDWSSFVPSGSNISMTHIYSNVGTYNVKVQAKDEKEMMSNLTHQILIINDAPSASIVSAPDNAHVGNSVTFTAKGSDPDGDRVAIRFDWGDGNVSGWSNFVSSGTNVSMSHTYNNTGTYYVKAQAKDEYGAVSNWSSSHKIVLTNDAPSASIVSAPDSAHIGNSVTFTSKATDPDGDRVAIRFDWGDGNVSGWSNFVSSGTNVSMGHTYNNTGTYYVKAQAKDEYGAVSNWSSSHKIVITNNSPSASIVSAPDSAHVGNSVTFTAKSSDPDGDRVAIRFDWGDGSLSGWSNFVFSGTNVSMSHTYNNTGTYYVKAQAKDEYGAVSNWSSSHKIVITNNSPDAPVVSGPDSAIINESITLTASTTDPDGDNVAIRFSWGDGDTSTWSSYVSSGQSVSMSHVYTTVGTCYVKAQAKDEYGAVSNWSSAHEIIVHGWVKTDLGSGGGYMYGVAVGDGRGDGKPRVYATCCNCHVYEFEWKGSSWVKTDLGSGGNNMNGVAVGDGRGDDKPRVYVACGDYHVYEFEWNGSSWVKTDLGSSGYWMSGVAIGDGRSNGKSRVYAACGDGHIYEFEWNGTSWVKADLGSGSDWIRRVAVGDGRSDGKPRVYAACDDGHVYEFEWDGSLWIKTDLGSGSAGMNGVAVGDGRWDGKSRVYAACNDGHVYEFEWNGSSWIKTDLGSGGSHMLGVAVGDGRGDGKPRVYAACADNHVYEFEWNGSSWIKTDLGSGVYVMNGVAIGDGRGDGKPKVYAASWDNHVYEFEWK